MSQTILSRIIIEGGLQFAREILPPIFGLKHVFAPKLALFLPFDELIRSQIHLFLCFEVLGERALSDGGSHSFPTFLQGYFLVGFADLLRARPKTLILRQIVREHSLVLRDHFFENVPFLAEFLILPFRLLKDHLKLGPLLMNSLESLLALLKDQLLR